MIHSLAYKGNLTLLKIVGDILYDEFHLSRTSDLTVSTRASCNLERPH